MINFTMWIFLQASNFTLSTNPFLSPNTLGLPWGIHQNASIPMDVAGRAVPIAIALVSLLVIVIIGRTLPKFLEE